MHLERNERDVAERILREVTQASDSSHRVTLQNTVTLHRAKLARVLGDEADAAAQLALARLAFSEPDKAVRQVFGVEAVEQALRFDPSNAAELIAELDQERVETQVLHVRLAVLDHDAATAIDLLHDLRPATTRRAEVERDVLTALSMLERDLEKANDHLRAALSAGQPEWMVRTIVDHGPDVHRLLQSFAPDVSNEQYVAALLAAASHMVAPVRRGPDAVARRAAQLTRGDGAALPVQPADLSGDRRRVVRVAQHAEVPRPQRVSQARCGVAQRGGRRRPPARSDLTNDECARATG